MYILLDVLVCRVCSSAEFFSSYAIQTTSKSTQRYYIPKRLIRYLLSNSFFFLLSLTFFSHKAGKAKRIEKCSARSRLLKQVFFTVQITNCPNNLKISLDILYSIRALFVLYFVQLHDNN